MYLLTLIFYEDLKMVPLPELITVKFDAERQLCALHVVDREVHFGKI